jgi:hypothetical protein
MKHPKLFSQLSLASLAPLALVLGLAGCASTPSGAPTSPAGMDEAAMMQAMMQLATPGPEHAALAKHVGAWKTYYEHKMGPDAPWTSSVGTTNAKMILGGRFLYEDVTINIPDMPPMYGVQILGYDNLTKEYESHWMDTMSTWMIHSRGKADAEGTIEFKGTMTDIMGTRPFRMVTKEQGDGSNYMEMYDTLPGGGEVLMMKATSKRN